MKEVLRRETYRTAVAEIEERIDRLLAVGVGESPREALSELARLGARLIIQRAVEDEFDAWLRRARYERRPEAPPGLRNGFRPRRVQTAEGELSVEVPQVREAAEPFVSKLFPRGTKLLRTEPLRAMVIGACVRGLSMRDVESLCEQAGLGKLSKSTASRICAELRERFEAFGRRDLYEIRLAALFLDATFLSVRPTGPKEGVLVAWGFTEDGERVLLAVMLGMRESHEDWLALARDLIARGLGAPMLIVADGAPGLIKAIEQCWPASDRQHCAVHTRPQPPRQAARTRARTRPPGLLAGAGWMTRPASATQGSGCGRWSTSSTTPATPPRPDASPTIWTRSSCTCATRPDTADAGDQQTCSSARSDGVDGEEVAREHARRLAADELAPGDAGSLASGSEPCFAQELADRRRRDAESERPELARDPLVAPTTVLARESEDQLADLTADRRSPRAPCWVGPAPRHELAMPADERVGRDEETNSSGRGRGAGSPRPGTSGRPTEARAARPGAAGWPAHDGERRSRDP
jgi:mutator family transposase